MTWVHEQIFAAGGKHIPTTWEAFADQTGIEAILHLAPGRSVRFMGPPPEAFLWLDITDEAQVGMGERRVVGKYLHECLKRGWSVLLHSSLGRHRTRWMYVAYCIYSGRSVQTTLRQVAEKPWLAPYYTDTAAWEAFARSIRSESPA